MLENTIYMVYFLSMMRRNTVETETLLYDLYTEAKFLDEIHTKILRFFLLAIHSHFYSFAMRFRDLYFFKQKQSLTYFFKLM
jgi:hypothetical protein